MKFNFLILFLVVFNLSRLTILSQDKKSDWEIFPIFNYDTDAGFGYGAKAYYYNLFKHEESFDIILFNSTKGEKWYRFIFSIPDAQRRLGKKYNYALDLIVDYDKWINYKFYHNSFSKINELSSLNNLEFETYVREPIELKVVLSRAFTRHIIAEVGVKFKNLSCFNFDPIGQLRFLEPRNTQYISVLLGFVFDTRSDFINPKDGIVLRIMNEFAKDITNTKENYYEIGLTFQMYNKLIYNKLILASRINVQAQTNSPYQNQLAIGGNKTLRGLPQDRYLSSSQIFINEEIRFPIWWRIGGVLGVDVGNSESTPKWILNSIIGLRFYMDNFVVRADAGFGQESTGFYFNFDHLF